MLAILQEYGILDERSVSKSVAYSNVAVNLTGLDYKTRFVADRTDSKRTGLSHGMR